MKKEIYHDVLINDNDDYVIVCVHVNNDNWDYWKVTTNGHERVSNIQGDVRKSDYWIDSVELKIIQNTHKVLDFYTIPEDTIKEVNSNFTAEDIPF